MESNFDHANSPYDFNVWNNSYMAATKSYFKRTEGGALFRWTSVCIELHLEDSKRENCVDWGV